MSTGILGILRNAAAELYPLITKELSKQSTKKYNRDEWTLCELDTWKNTSFPRLLKERHDSEKSLYMTKDELVLLMDWKLAKGKFRPSLPKLIKSNSPESVLNFSREGYSIFMSYIELTGANDWTHISTEDYKITIRASLKALCQLKGVGPATASLMLSLLCEVTKFAPPFFSDESFMYFIRDPLRPLQPIKYTVREYVEEFVPVLAKMSAQDRLSSPAILEKGSWSLKMYHLYRIDRLTDLELPFEISDESAEAFKDISKYISGNIPEKRTTTREGISGGKKRKTLGS
ncbi:hypothetical protein METBIDRAFT_13656 [Metschnikowia bicuspidata var. bicuspidata NRRL YB-4993]|uniref:Uncharacterized protein n=1 Tax=Metschnikowia bicuspidata var. bicuspidata NRRL YB-4993 TaxID=869754 RepID=A0A1A0H5J5_9ASCO|nr:hypothetical protein METBIDRAFT_13656 [Metschnikowia bicuspidata var. bicuspidata NRRL YB-4993]OBA19364.1 hypothetical protein METBIDRAFT_13656 [Metschnikowia bicuspidata var. bicuspidata NRRL YB-4993]